MAYKTATDLINEAKTRIREVTAADVLKTLGQPGAPVLLDVREPNETNLGRIPGAIVIPRGTMESKIARGRHAAADGLQQRGLDGRGLGRVGLGERARRRLR